MRAKNIHAYRQAQRLRAGTEAWLLVQRGGRGESDTHVRVTIVRHGIDRNTKPETYWTDARHADGRVERIVERAQLSPVKP